MLLKSQIKSAGYGGDAVLRNIQFELPPGRILAVIGPNGSGKTTLVRALSGTLPQVDGSLSINGTDLLAVCQSERAKLLAVVPQSTHIPSAFRVEEVVMLGRTPYLSWMGQQGASDQAAVEEAMRVADVLRFRGRLCGTLSAGERQRVILARALAQDTPVLLMDEPTSHLDLRYQVEFLELASRLASENGKAVLAALHDLNLAARFGQEVLALKDGKIAAFGKTDEVLRADVIEEIYGLRVEVFPSPVSGRPVVLPA
ncbi:MAG: ABC transporter ATP-binding protein [Anaerolineales bacterium]|nr:ABC transporter ATP-binding protein [Anaerolineales bacterium]